MSRSKRKAVIRTLQRVAVVLAVVDGAVYFALVGWLGNRVHAAQAERDAAYLQVRRTGRRVLSLEKILASLPDVQERIASFEKQYVPPRRRGFSRGARLLRVVAEHSGVELTDVNYRLNTKEGEPLDRLSIKLSVEGPYASLIAFAHALETADDFLVVRDFSFQPGDNGTLALQMTADMYLTP
jgi:Tfp pilus assembly protein PilO